tara:strand:- start:203 stop:583 length:381 start_codon:yes stop_codon:yes gene_type:complete
VPAISSNKKIFFINNLIEDDKGFYRTFTKEPIIGNIYKYFEQDHIPNVFVGTITEDGRHGKWTRWWNHGRKKKEGTYLNNKKNGVWNEWDTNGKKYLEIIYKNGKILQIKNCYVEKCDSLLNRFRY